MKATTSFLLLFLFISCEKSPLFDAYDSLEGTWKIITLTENNSKVDFPNSAIFFNSCNYKNKNLKNGLHACVGKLYLPKMVLDFSYKVEDVGTVLVNNMGILGGSSIDVSAYLALFEKKWIYKIDGINLKLESIDGKAIIILEKTAN